MQSVTVPVSGRLSTALRVVQDPGTLFFGPRKYINDLWLIINHQKHYIQTLQDMLGVDPEIPGRTPSDLHTTGKS